MISKYRDISIIEVGGELLTVACDSCGGVGLLSGDSVRTDGFNVGYHTAFVALAETLAIGAEPTMIIDTLSVSLDDYGKSILYGIKTAGSEAGLDAKNTITGSSEENFKTLSTGIGVVVLGRLSTNDFIPVPVENKYDAVLFGFPCVGDQVLVNKSKILSLDVLKRLVKDDNIIDIIPAGSRGVLFEANQLALGFGYEFVESFHNPELIRRSAGPATCAVTAVKKGAYKNLDEINGIPITLIGEFSKPL
ncbi:MAG: hypothetical protein R3232_00830 [Clostridia bacterium]|nr:hypothetical protein [Clostridia bacterium]